MQRDNHPIESQENKKLEIGQAISIVEKPDLFEIYKDANGQINQGTTIEEINFKFENESFEIVEVFNGRDSRGNNAEMVVVKLKNSSDKKTYLTKVSDIAEI